MNIYNKQQTTDDKQNKTNVHLSFIVSRLSNQGFTFVETLVAIAILLMAVAAPLTLASQGLAASRVARDQVIATHLAQEAIEYARNIRDTNVLAGDEWLQGLEDCIDAVCMVDVPAGTIERCVGGGCAPLVFNEATGLYGLSSGGNPSAVETKFTRSLSAEIAVENPEEALLTATISWRDGLANRSLSIEESIFNWQ